MKKKLIITNLPRDEGAPADCPICGRPAEFESEQEVLEWWRCHHCELDFSTVGVKEYK